MCIQLDSIEIEDNFFRIFGECRLIFKQAFKQATKRTFRFVILLSNRGGIYNIKTLENFITRCSSNY